MMRRSKGRTTFRLNVVYARALFTVCQNRWRSRAKTLPMQGVLHVSCGVFLLLAFLYHISIETVTRGTFFFILFPALHYFFHLLRSVLWFVDCFKMIRRESRLLFCYLPDFAGQFVSLFPYVCLYLLR